MPVFRITGGARLYQHWPGEEGCGVDTVSSGVGVGTFANPGNFYSNPEWGLGYEEAIRRWQAAELRGSVADYDYFKQDEVLSASMLGTDAPWAFVSPSSWRVSQIWDEFTAAGGVFTMVADAGAYVWTGFTMGPDILMPVAGGVYSLVGTAVNFLIKMPAAAGSYLLTGTAILPDIVMPLASGVYTLTGAAATLFKSIIMAAAAGVYNLTGTAISTLINTPVVAGVYSLTGSAANLTKSFILSAASGVYSIVGSAVDLVFSGAAAAINAFLVGDDIGGPPYTIGE